MYIRYFPFPSPLRSLAETPGTGLDIISRRGVVSDLREGSTVGFKSACRGYLHIQEIPRIEEKMGITTAQKTHVKETKGLQYVIDVVRYICPCSSGDNKDLFPSLRKFSISNSLHTALIS
jgi:hypothetical protein